MSTDLLYETIAGQAARIKSGEITPTQLIRSALDRTAKLSPRLLAFLDVFEAQAMADAEAAEREIANGNYRGPLHGIPIGLKDLVDVAGTPTTGGSPVLRDNIAKTDATVTRKLKEAGAIITSKTNLVEFALGATGLNPHTGDARNPWDEKRVTAGSSSGSGAAVATGMVSGALGSDTGGSIRMPASLCGIAGLKPTYGRVSRHGVLDLSWSLDHVGPMTRSSEDCAIMMNALSGYDPNDPGSADEPVPDFTATLGRGLDGVRVGVPTDFFFEDIDPQIETAVRSAIELLERNGAKLREIPMPWVSKGRAINLGVMLPEAVAVHEKLLSKHADQYSPQVRGRIQAAFNTSAVDYIRAQRARAWFNRQMADAMRDIDVLVTPTVPIQTPTIEECTPRPEQPSGGTGLPRFTGVFDVTGQPSLSVNCGFTGDGMPIGLMISGHAFEEQVVLQVGHAYEQMTDWSKRRPPV